MTFCQYETYIYLRAIRLQQNIKHLRQEFGFSQSVLGEKIGVGKAQISAYEKGGSYPSVERLCMLADIFQVKIDQFVYSYLTKDDEVKEPNNQYQAQKTKDPLSNPSLVRLVMRLEIELHEIKERLKKEAPDLAKKWGITE